MNNIFLRTLLFFSIFLSSINGYGQQKSIFDKVSHRSVGQGEISIHQSKALEQMMSNFAVKNKSDAKVEGYRIQLFSGTGASARKESQDVKIKMLEYFPQESVSVEYNAPFWRVRTGVFRHKHEALPLLRKIKSSFPNCYVVKDTGIRLSEFK